MQYVVMKSITFNSLTKEVFVPAGVMIHVDPETMVAYFGGHHFDVKHYEIQAIC